MTDIDSYYKLPAGTRYIVQDGRAVPLSEVPGKTTGSFHYPEGADNGYQVHVRTLTGWEIQAQKLQAAKAQTPVVRSTVPADFFSDWK